MLSAESVRYGAVSVNATVVETMLSGSSVVYVGGPTG